jgi:hypothetical protein
MEGKIIGNVVVLDRNFNKTNRAKHAFWNCKCLNCGKLYVVSGAKLREKYDYCCKKCSHPTINYQNLSGQQFAGWIVLEKAEVKNHAQYYKCKCLKCEEIFSIQGKNLKSGNTTQCLSCSRKTKNSKGENYILQILIKNKVNFKQEYLQIIKNRRLLLDFVILNQNNQIIKMVEFDGEQHYNFKNKWFSEDLVIRDQLKNNWCQENNIKPIRYRTINEINLKDLID